MTRTKLLDRVRKILARTTSPNPHEAATAAALVAELCEKYQIDRAELGATPDPVGELTLDVLSHLVVWRARLATGLARHFRCHCFSTRTLEPNKPPVVRLVAAGEPTDLAALSYLYAVLAKDVERLSREHCRMVEATEAGDFADSFKRGMVDTIRARLAEEERKRRRATQTPGLIRLSDALARAKDHVARKPLQPPTMDEPASAANAVGYLVGAQVGHRVVLRPEKALGVDAEKLTPPETPAAPDGQPSSRPAPGPGSPSGRTTAARGPGRSPAGS